MNIEKHLILVVGEDKTERIKYCHFSGGYCVIVYENGSKKYKYKDYKVEWHKNPRIIAHEDCIVYDNDKPLSGIEKVLDFGKYVRIIFKTGYQRIYEHSSIIIEKSCLVNNASNNCFQYLKQLANNVGIKEVDFTFLSKQYNRLNSISPRSVLAAYLVRKPLKRESRETEPIFPFGFNLSQKSATEKALSEQISVIEGPPGTGKTQTILNIIANAIVNNKTVAVVSNNNSATANVLEKLQKYGVDFIAAYLGNNDNKEKFFSEQKNTYPNMSDWGVSYSKFRSIKRWLLKSQRKLNKMLKYKNKSAKLKNELTRIQIEFEYFYKYYKTTNEGQLKLNSFFRISADSIISIMLNYQRKIEKGNISLADKIYNLFVHGMYNFTFYDNTPELVVSFLQKTYYDKKTKELKNKVEALSNKLGRYDIDNAMKEYSEISMKLFKAKLADKYGAGRKRTVFSKDVLWKNFTTFIKEYPVILSTTHSLRNCTSENYLFDYVIIDEASQVDLVSGALALSCAKNVVIVGDTKQLPNVITAEVEETTRNIFECYSLDSAYSYADNSLLTSIINLYTNVPRTLLKEHYRCHPKIIGFCNQKFYNNELVILTNEHDNDRPLVLYKTAKGRHARGNLNQRQIDIVFEEIIPEQKINDVKQSVGIISPFRLQTNELNRSIGTRNIEADTVHKFQGREKDVIILTTVANEVAVNDFVDNPNLINVAVSRAKDKLIVVVSDGSESWNGTNIGDLVRYIQYNNFEMVESQIYSVFDLLYSSYSDKLLSVMKNIKNISRYKSENLMNMVIETVLSEPEFQSLDRVMHQPLKMLIKDPARLSKDEYKYAMNILTHTDFVIFNKLDKMPVLVVEVDGYAYHANNPRQLERDKMKDEILQKYNIPILRIKTNESGEEKRLRKVLGDILKLV